MRLVFCGTPDFAVPTLEALLDARSRDSAGAHAARPPRRPQDGAAAICRQARRARAQPRVLQPEKIKNNQELRAELESIRPDAIIVVAYGRIIPEWMLDLPRFGNINLHGSLLPKYRGAAPIQWAVANGETDTGVTTMRLDEGLDTGDTLLEHRLAIGPDTTASELYPQLASIGAELMIETLDGLEHRTITPRPQDNAARNARADPDPRRWPHGARPQNSSRSLQPLARLLPLARRARRVPRQALPRASHASDRTASEPALAPGELALAGDLLLAGTADGNLALDEVQMEGKARMPGAQFAKDFQLHRGERLA